jgi:hypothetical protein
MSLHTISISFNDYKLEGLEHFFKVFESNDTLSNISYSIPEKLEPK